CNHHHVYLAPVFAFQEMYGLKGGGWKRAAFSGYRATHLPMNFTNVIKPTHLCNLACKYCYNDDVRDPIMRDEVLHRTIEQTFSYVRRFEHNRTVSFVWHGGEPLIAKRAFYERAVEYQSRYAEGVRCENSVQTNGTLIDDSWLEFFRIANFS